MIRALLAWLALAAPASALDCRDFAFEGLPYTICETAPRDLVADLGLVAAERGEDALAVGAAEREDVGRRPLEVGRHAHLAHGDRHAVELGVVEVALGEDLGHGAADQLAHAELALGGTGGGGGGAAHARHVGAGAGNAKRA